MTKKIILIFLLLALCKTSYCAESLFRKCVEGCIYETKLGVDDDSVFIGYEKSNQLEPKIKLTRWNGEESLSIKFNSFNNTPMINGSQITLSGADKIFYVKKYSKDVLKFGINFTKKPSSNTIIFQMDNWENFEFLYQPPLLNSISIGNGEIKGIDPSSTEFNYVTRPDDVDGSYAVYHKTKANHIIGQTDYHTGKFCHIYRPKFIDSSGKKVWGNINIKDGIYTVTIPQDFIDKAKYPIISNDTIGYTSVGGTFTNGLVYWGAGKYLVQASSSGTASAIKVYTHTDSDRIKLTIYNGTDNLATRLVQTYEIPSPVPTTTWNSVDISGEALSITSGTSYYPFIAFELNGHGLKYDVGSSGNHGYDTSETYAAAFPESLTGNMTLGSARISMYIEYSVPTTGYGQVI